MRRRIVSVLLLPLIAGVACNRDDKQPDSETSAAVAESAPAVAPEADASVLAAVERLGDEGAVVAVVRPSQWASLHAALVPWWSSWGPDAQVLLDAGTAEALPGLLAYPLGLDKGAAKLEGWDPSRPVVASLFEVPYAGPPGAIAAGLPLREGWVPPMRHQVIVPASSTDELVASLSKVLDDLGKPAPALAEGTVATHAVTVGEMTVALVPETGAVRVVVFQGDQGMSDAARRKHIKRRLEPTSSPSPHTAARHGISDPDATVALWVRSWRLRAVGSWRGVSSMLMAFGEVSSNQQSLLIARGTQIVLDAERMASDVGADADDAVFTLKADEGIVRMQSTVSLTPEGKRLMDAASKSAGDAFETKSDEALAELMVLADLGALVSQADAPPAFENLESPIDGLRLVQESGGLGKMYMLLRHPFGSMGLASSMASRPDVLMPVTTLPTAVKVAWLGSKDHEVTGAMAMQWPSGYSIAPLAELVGKLKSDSDFASLRMEAGERGGEPTTVLGLGVEPSSVFDPSASGKANGVFEARADLDRIKAEIARHQPGAAALSPSGAAVFRMELHDRALVGELAWNPKGKDVTVSAPRLDPTAKWDSPIGAGDSEGVACLAETTKVVAHGFHVLTSVSADQMSTVMAKTMTELQAPLACATKDPATKEAATELSRSLVINAAGILVSQHDDDGALALLKQQCERSKDIEICELEKRHAMLPRPSLPKASPGSGCTPSYDRVQVDLEVRIDSSVVTIGGKSVDAAKAGIALKAATVEFLREEAERIATDRFAKFALPEDKPRPPALGLKIDGTVSMSRVLPILEAAAAVDIDRLVVFHQADDGKVSQSSVSLAAKAKFFDGLGLKGGVGRPSGPAGTGVLGAMHDAEPGWGMLTVDAGSIEVRGTAHPVPLELTPIDPTTIRAAALPLPELFVHAKATATWADVVVPLATLCPAAQLVLAPDAP